MNNKIPYVIVSILFLTLAFYGVKSALYPVAPDFQATEMKTVTGVVTEIDKEKMMVDGPLVIALMTDDSGVEVIAVPSMGRNLCVAKDSIVDADNVEVGDVVTVKGDVDMDGYIVPCMNEAHFLRIGQ
jgi:hypothetical protein